MRTLLSILFLALLVTVGGTALAKTPDGEPPSVEADCNNEPPGLFGLCNAYCEALDCANPDVNRSAERACDRVLGNYQKKKGDPDAIPPCEGAECPSNSDCLQARETAGCGCSTCEAKVCALDPFCCTNTWDDLCVASAIANCTFG